MGEIKRGESEDTKEKKENGWKVVEKRLEKRSKAMREGLIWGSRSTSPCIS